MWLKHLFIWIGIIGGGATATADETFVAERALLHEWDGRRAKTSGPTWAFARTSDDRLWVGSNRLVSFDGTRWTEFPIPGAFAVRALDPVNQNGVERLFVGAAGTVGLLERNHADWQFRSLRTELTAAEVGEIADVWQVIATRTGAFFVLSDRLLRWDGKKFDHWYLPGRIRLQAFRADEDRIWVAQDGAGLLAVGPTGGPVVALAEADFPQRTITWIAALPAGGNFLIGYGDAVYEWREGNAPARIDALSTLLKGSTPFQAEWLDATTLAIGTYRKGVLWLHRDEKGGLSTLGWTNHGEGLPDDAVTGMRAIGSDLWVGYADGLTRLQSPSLGRMFLHPAGTVGGRFERILSSGGKLWSITNRAAYRWDEPGRAFVRSSEPLPRLTAAALHDGELWYAGFGGIWHLATNGPIQEYFAPGDVSALSESPHLGGLLLVDGQMLKGIVPSAHGGWAERNLGIDLGDSATSLWETKEGDVWVATARRGIMHFRWTERSSEPALRLVVRYRPGDGLPEGATLPRLTILGSRVVAFCSDRILMLEKSGNRSHFETIAGLTDFRGVAASTASGETAFWIVERRETEAAAVIRVSPEADGLRWEPVPCSNLPSIGQPCGIASIDDSLWIGGTLGLLHLRTRESALPSPPNVRVQLERNAETSATIRCVFSSPNLLAGQTVFFQTRLLPDENSWSDAQLGAERAFTALGPGRYVLEVRGMDIWGRTGAVASMALAVPTPWWRTPYAFLAYAIFALAAGAGVQRWRVMRLKRQNERLNELVRLRTRELELSNTAKSEFLENISHEIRNPLNGLNGLLSLLQQEQRTVPPRNILQSLQACARTLTRTCDEVLGFSRLEYGYVALEERPFSLRALLEDVLDAHRANALRAGCAFDLQWDEKLSAWFIGDAAKLRSIVSNFVSNAVKYAPGTAIELRVEVHGAGSESAEVTIEVIDLGPGVPVEEQELIFHKFVRGTHAKRQKIAGTGLGLATCRTLARTMNGSVGIDSRIQRGATFFVCVPLRPTSPPAQVQVIAAESEHTADLPKALVVEDEPYNQAVLQGILRQLSYEPFVAATKQDVVELTAAHHFEVVFMDWNLPDGIGSDVTAVIRAASHGAAPLVFAATAHDTEEIRNLCRQAKMNGFILKPYAIDEIREALAKAMLNGGEWEEARRAPQPPGKLDREAFTIFAREKQLTPEKAAEMFVGSLERELNDLRRAFSRGDRNRVYYTAHRLRAIGGLIRAEAFEQDCRVIESIARTDEFARLGERIEALTRASEMLKHHLVSFQRPGSG